MSHWRYLIAGIVLALVGCSKASEESGSGGTGDSTSDSGGAASGGTAEAGGATGGAAAPQPRYHPPAEFESCKHASVTKDCSGGWCRLPPSCFVMGSPEDEWGHRGRDSENRTAVTLTHSIEVQQEELNRAEWEEITGSSAPGPENCTDPECPVAMVSWWDAVHAANLLSEKKGFEPCYEPVGCSGSLGVDLACEGVSEPDKSVYECEGYRLPTRAEAEYAARAGTISTFYSGDITPYSPDSACMEDPALEPVAWYCNNSDGRPHVGGELRPNDFGIHDLLGNLGEWTNEEAHYSSSLGGANPRGEVELSQRRIVFSPQYDDKSWILRAAAHLTGPWDARGIRTGFRLVRTLPD